MSSLRGFLRLFSASSGVTLDLRSAGPGRHRRDRRVRGAGKDQLCLSPQCGFSSTVESNVLTADEQKAKLELIRPRGQRGAGLARWASPDCPNKVTPSVLQHQRGRTVGPDPGLGESR